MATEILQRRLHIDVVREAPFKAVAALTGWMHLARYLCKYRRRGHLVVAIVEKVLAELMRPHRS